MAIRVGCDACGVRLKTKDSNVGRAMRCPRCRSVVQLAAVVGPGVEALNERARLAHAARASSSKARQASAGNRPGGRKAAPTRRPAPARNTASRITASRHTASRNTTATGKPASRGKVTEPEDVVAMTGGITRMAVGFLTVAIVAGLGVSSFFLVQVQAKNARIDEQSQSMADKDDAYNQMRAERDQTLVQLEEVQAGVERRYQHAALLAREARYREAEVAFQAITEQFPEHVLADDALEQVHRMRSLLMERNLADLGVTVSDPVTRWSTTGTGRQLLYPEIQLRIRNVATRAVDSLHVRADFVAVSPDENAERRVLGDDLQSISSVLEPGMAAEVILRGLGSVNTEVVAGALPEMVAYVYVKQPGEAFRKVGAFPVLRQVAALR